MKHFTYIIYSAFKNKYYIGSTNNIANRLNKHNTNHKGFTGKTGDWKVVYFETFESKEIAYKREKEIKAWKSRKMIEKLILGSVHPDCNREGH